MAPEQLFTTLTIIIFCPISPVANQRQEQVSYSGSTQATSYFEIHLLVLKPVKISILTYP